MAHTKWESQESRWFGSFEDLKAKLQTPENDKKKVNYFVDLEKQLMENIWSPIILIWTNPYVF